MNQAIIRQATLNDLETLLQFEQGVITAERPFDVTLKEEKIHYYNIPVLITSSNVEILVAELDGKIVGCGYARIEQAGEKYKNDRYAYLGFMYVLPEFRRKGINALILNGLKSWCKLREVYELRLEVYSENDKAIKAYEKAGFLQQMIEMRMELEKE